jgi:hypothetical protein
MGKKAKKAKRADELEKRRNARQARMGPHKPLIKRHAHGGDAAARQDADRRSGHAVSARRRDKTSHSSGGLDDRVGAGSANGSSSSSSSAFSSASTGYGRLGVKSTWNIGMMYVDASTREVAIVAKGFVDGSATTFVRGPTRDLVNRCLNLDGTHTDTFYFRPGNDEVTASGVVAEMHMRAASVRIGDYQTEGSGPSLLYQFVVDRKTGVLPKIKERASAGRGNGSSAAASAGDVSVLRVYCDNYSGDVLVETDQRETNGSSYVGDLSLASQPSVFETDGRHFVHFKLMGSGSAAQSYARDASSRLGVSRERISTKDFYDGTQLIPAFVGGHSLSTLSSLERKAGFDRREERPSYAGAGSSKRML